MNRFILHCDLDSFYASVEVRANPEHKGKPVIVGADPKEGKGRGVVLTCSYEARKFGLHSGMPISKAYKLCPHGTYLKPTFKKYSEASNKVMDILKKQGPLFQQVGIDEAYLDISDICSDDVDVRFLIEKIRKEVYEKVGITISVGCAHTKSLAKIASGTAKPNGITLFQPENFKEYLKDLDITRIPGIGKKSKIYYHKKGITKIGDIINIPLHKMIEKFGKHGKWVWDVAHGLSNSKISKTQKIRNSISKEITFIRDTNNFKLILLKLFQLNELINAKIKKKNFFYRTITLKIRLSNYSTYTRSRTFDFSIQDKDVSMKTILKLFEEFYKQNKEIRLIGIKFSNLIANLKNKQLKIINFV